MNFFNKQYSELRVPAKAGFGFLSKLKLEKDPYDSASI